MFPNLRLCPGLVCYRQQLWVLAAPLAHQRRQSVDRYLYHSWNQVRGFGTALIAALVIGLVNATLGFILKI